jgi:hypothetical protein
MSGCKLLAGELGAQAHAQTDGGYCLQQDSPFASGSSYSNHTSNNSFLTKAPLIFAAPGTQNGCC